MVKRTNLVKLAAQLGTRATQVEYLRGKGVLPTQVTCQKCGEFVSKTEYCTNKGTFKYYVISFEAFSDFHPHRLRAHYQRVLSSLTLQPITPP